MSTVTKFTLNKGVDNESVITIKQNGNTLPMAISGSDTFTAKLYLLSTMAEVVTLTMTNVASTGKISIKDGPNGKLSMIFYASLVNGLITDRGDKADRYYNRPTYKLVISGNTVANGAIIVTIPLVYIV